MVESDRDNHKYSENIRPVDFERKTADIYRKG